MVAATELTDAEFERIYGRCAPNEPRDAAAAFAGYPGLWWIAGGWSVEAFSGISRPHHDCDPSILRADLDAFRDHVRGTYDVWVVSSGALKPLLPGQSLEDAEPLPHGWGQVWLRRGADQPWEFDVLLAPGDRDTWVYKRDESVTMPMSAALWERDGIRYLQPQIQLLYKAKGLRPQDQADFETAAPLLSSEQRDWLREMLQRTLPDHPWLRHFALR